MKNLKFYLSSVLIFFITSAFTQSSLLNHDSTLKKEALNAFDPAVLSYNLTSHCKTNLEKVKAIFNWITENISYHVISYNNNPYRPVMYWSEGEDDTSQILKPVNERVAKMVLKKRLAICDGYARLFKTLCDDAGITSEIITGYARTNMHNTVAQFGSNHKWNAVFIDSNWYLLDATWASGYINYNNEFVQDYDERYFLTPPEEFIQDHYPEDMQWTLLNKPPTIQEFYHSPFKTIAYHTSYILSYTPANGVLETAIGDTIKFSLEVNNPQKTLWVLDHPYIDSTILSMGEHFGFVNPDCILKGKKISCTYVVSDDTPQWLTVIYNNEVVLRYKLNIKKDLTVENVLP